MTARKLHIVGALVLASVVSIVLISWPGSDARHTRADPSNATQVALGAEVYRNYCAACHGTDLEGQADWRARKPDGRLPAPPHDESGHTWHHPDEVLFRITRDGVSALIPGYESDMPAYAGVLEDEEIWAVIAYLKSRWPQRFRDAQADIDDRARQ